MADHSQTVRFLQRGLQELDSNLARHLKTLEGYETAKSEVERLSAKRENTLASIKVLENARYVNAELFEDGDGLSDSEVRRIARRVAEYI